ncbi:prenyltransferase/squalene oxidase repeat-containing protein [Thermococcus prieurii]
MGIYWKTGWSGSNGNNAIENSGTTTKLSCLPTRLNLSTFLGESWINYTSRRLHLAECPEGGFTEIDDTITPDIVSTYYFVTALKMINQTPYNRLQTIKWLHENERNLFENTTSDYTADFPKFWIVYYGVMTLSMLNSSPKNPDRIISFILSMKQRNGSFVYKGMDFTPQPIELLHVLGYNLSSLTKTREYCIEQFENLTVPDGYDGLQFMNFLFNFPYYTKCLKLLGVNYTKLRGYHRDLLFIQNLSRNIKTIISYRPPLFIIAHVAQLLREYHLLNSTVSNEIYNYVISQELPDGGFNLFGKNYGEFQGTYYAVKAIVAVGRKPDRKTIDFIHSWESPLGGFGFPFQKTCGPILTYMAVYVAKKIGMPLNKTKLEGYLENALRNRWPYGQDDPGALYAVYFTYKELNLTIDSNDLNYLKNETIRLIRLYLTHKREDLLMDDGWISLIELGNSIGIKLSPKTKSELIREILSKKNDDGTFGIENGTGVIFYQTTNAVMLLYALGYNYNDTDTLQYLLRTMHDGGWGYPDLYNTYRVVEALTHMGHCPENIQSLIGFIHSLKYKYGGFLFYRGADYYGGLQETYYALRILELIGAIN